ncbi:MAG: hypothetical protein CM15mP128_1490 [Methanobacteriota archaeon]|nr:MAG: hypothetical protein CM15mP128_1490 [Euryarchaeota archaeon]
MITSRCLVRTTGLRGKTPVPTTAALAKAQGNSAYDAASHRSFVVNAVEGAIDILDLSDPTAPTPLHTRGIPNGEPNSVDVHNGPVAVAGVGEEGPIRGKTPVMDAFTPRHPS